MTAVIVRDQANGWSTYQMPDVISGQRVFESKLPQIAGAVTVEDVAYWIFCGTISIPITAAFVKFHVSTGGASTQVAEVALASSPLPPNGAAQVLTKIVANGTLSDLTGTGVMKNTVSLATVIPAGTHLWAGLRTAMGTTEPTVWGHTADRSTGQILSTATASALTGAGPWTGALITAAVTWQAPALMVTLE